MKKIIQKEIQNRPKSIEDFSNYAKLVNKHRANISNYESRITNIKNFYEVARANYSSAANAADENQMDNQFQELWKCFMTKIQEAVEYINIQSPNILDQLNQLYAVNCSICH
jgi:hypothetical protein